MNKKKAWLYCRVAHEDCPALEAQKRKLLAYADQNGFETIGLSCDIGSGLTMDRPGWKEVEKAIDGKKAGTVLAVNGSRIARNIVELLNCADWLNQRGVQLVTETDGEIKQLRVAVYMRLARAED